MLLTDLNEKSNLTKDDLENKKKLDQELFTTLIMEYNDASNTSYGLQAFKDIPQIVDPSIFKRIFLLMLVGSMRLRSSKISPRNTNSISRLGQNLVIMVASTNSQPRISKPSTPTLTVAPASMIYMHYYMQLHHNILATCVALLPSDVARRSTAPRKLSNYNSANGSKKSGKGGDSGEKGGGKYVGKASGIQVALTSIASKNNAQQRKIELDMKHSEQTAMTVSLTLSNQIKEEKE